MRKPTFKAGDVDVIITTGGFANAVHFIHPETLGPLCNVRMSGPRRIPGVLRDDWLGNATLCDRCQQRFYGSSQLANLRRARRRNEPLSDPRSVDIPEEYLALIHHNYMEIFREEQP